MSNELATTQPKASALALMAARCQVEPTKLHATLKNTVFKGATDDELLALVVTANTFQLNPLLRELYAFPKKGGGIVPLVGLDGWLKIANRQPNFDGMEVEVFGDGPKPTHAICRIHLKDRAHPVTITEYFDECKRDTDSWRQMPRRMLRNKAIIQAVRVAFGVGGIHDEDEAAEIAAAPEPRNVTPAQAKRNPFAKTAPKLEASPAVDAEPEQEWTGEEPSAAQDEMPI